MKSSSGQYFQALDQIRALAAFTVFAWHFMHFNDGHLAPPLLFPLSFLTEGHTGVAIFMTLSGYLFAKLLDGKRVLFIPFLWNRFLRLAPLLFLVILIIAIQHKLEGNLYLFGYAMETLRGALFPALPNGGWSITVEFHFYIVLPLLLYLSARSRKHLLGILILPIGLRLAIYLVRGEVQNAAYWTIIGRLDQFVLGIFFFQCRDFFKGKGAHAAALALLFLVFWYAFDLGGGFYRSPTYPSPSPLWIIITTLEGAAYGALIAWHDSTFSYSDARSAKFIALIGTYSYSIYLLHFFFVFKMPRFVDTHIVSLSNPYVQLAASVPCFLALLPLSWLSYRFIEEPFLRFRKPYLAPASGGEPVIAPATQP